jgi:hypothetical protein
MRTDGQTNITKLIVAARNLAKAPDKNGSKYILFKSLFKYTGKD